MDSTPLLVIILDAFVKDAVSSLCYKIKNKSCISGSIVPPFCFEPDAALLCGRYPEESNSGTHYWFDPERSPYKGYNLLAVADKLPYYPRLAVRRLFREFKKMRGCQTINTARIPFSFLSYFEPVSIYMRLVQGFYKFPTLFDLLREKNCHWIYLGTPVSSAKSEDIWRDFRSQSLDGVSLILLFVEDLDNIGHHHGPDSEEYRIGLKKVGELIMRSYSRVQKMSERSRCIIFGDHGMVRIQKLVDISACLKGLNLRIPEDYLYFLDSTLVRFWFFNEKARFQVFSALADISGGTWITEKDKRNYRMRYPHNRFGDAIWWADGGTLVFPNFWQDRVPVKGMHGYRQEVKENHAGFILVDPEMEVPGVQNLKKPLEMVDMFATMVELLGLEMPKGSHGVSVRERMI